MGKVHWYIWSEMILTRINVHTCLRQHPGLYQGKYYIRNFWYLVHFALLMGPSLRLHHGCYWRRHWHSYLALCGRLEKDNFYQERRAIK